MKIAHLFAFIIISLSTLVAQAFPTQVYVNVTPTLIAAQACNQTYNQVIFCRVNAYGYYPTGAWTYAWMSMPLYPGQCDWAYVNAPPAYYGYMPFVNGNADAECEFLN
jgi:hypothetical protein